jgi:hypothetical protein
MSDLAEREPLVPPLLRDRSGVQRVTTPGLGRSRTSDWTIEGGHFAGRCQAFILIALGESIVIIGATLTDVKQVTAASVTSFAVSFAVSVALWWLYFDQSAAAAAEMIARSDDPGRLGRSAYHLIHPVMVAGIIVSWPRLAGIVVLGLLALAAHTIPALALAACTAVLVIAVAASDRLPWLPVRRSQRPEPRPGTRARPRARS